MRDEDYNKRIREIEEERVAALQKLYIDYAMSRVKFEIGDTVRESRWTFIIDKITVAKSFGMPVPVYHGYELKKDLTPKKNNNRVSSYGNDSVELLTPTKQK